MCAREDQYKQEGVLLQEKLRNGKEPLHLHQKVEDTLWDPGADRVSYGVRMELRLLKGHCICSFVCEKGHPNFATGM